MEVLLSEISKIIIMLITFSVFNKGIDFIIIMLFTIPLKVHLGGVHMKSYAQCLGFSSAFCLLIVLLNRYFTILPHIFVLLSICCGVLLYFIAPVIPIERRDITSIPKEALRNRGLLLVTCYTMLFVLWHNDFTNYGQWIILIQTIILFITKGGFKNERKIAKTT